MEAISKIKKQHQLKIYIYIPCPISTCLFEKSVQIEYKLRMFSVRSSFPLVGSEGFLYSLSETTSSSE